MNPGLRPLCFRWEGTMKLRLIRPREFAQTLRALARLQPRQVEEYLDRRPEEWEALAGADPSDAADILEAIDEEAAGVLLTELESEDAADVLEEVRPDLAAELIEDLSPAQAAGILEEMSPGSAVDVLSELDEEVAGEILALMEEAAAQEVRQLLGYPPDSAGGLMTTEIAMLPIGLSAGEAIERIRQLHEELEDLSYVYIVDDAKHLKGVLSFRDLVFVRPGVGLAEAMIPNPVSVLPITDREEVAELIQRYHLFGLPVVDDTGALLGMVTTESVIDAIQQEASEDFAASVGAGAGETVYSPVMKSVRSRLPWLGVNLLLALTTAVAINEQTGVITREPVLAALMPVIATLGGNAGTQSLAVVIRSLALDGVPRARVFRVMLRQLAIGVVNAAALAVAAGLLATALVGSSVFNSRVDPARVGWAVAIAVAINLTIAVVAGGGVPMVLRRLGLDPALASSIFVTMITDLFGFGGFLLVASLLL